jgi:hypothetical protein
MRLSRSLRVLECRACGGGWDAFKRQTCTQCVGVRRKSAKCEIELRFFAANTGT